jgi:zinc transport system substrate-binding protein
MVQPGHNPATYEPLPRQITLLSKADVYFRIGVPFEKAWMDNIRSSNPKMKIVDTRKGISLREIEDFREIEKKLNGKHTHEKSGDHGHEHKKGEKDPHVWMNPRLVKIQAKNIYEALVQADPENKEFYQKNLNDFQKELDVLYKDMKEAFSQIKSRKILVFHPFLGYLTDEFGLAQIPIEIQGKTPTSRELSRIIDWVKKENIRVVFVQKQFSTREAKTIASAIKGEVIVVNPLAENYIENMRDMTRVLQKELK